jgi:aminoglycoside/choline kinase family phosphotransferase
VKTSDIERFCTKRFGPDCSAERLAGDASARSFYRVTHGRSSCVLMDTGVPIEPPSDPFLKAAELFRSLGLPVPRILEVFPGKGLILLEDLGDLLLQRRLADCPDEKRNRLYRKALHHLIHLHTDGTLALARQNSHPAAVVALDQNRFLFELDFALEHFIGGLCGARLSDADRSSLRGWFEELSTEVASFGRVLCHRDYHSRNLIIHRGKLFILDFQDARWGPIPYDIASLLLDSYVILPPRFVDGMVEKFRQSLLARIDGMAAGTINTSRWSEPGGTGASSSAGGLKSLLQLAPPLRDPVEFRRRFDLTCLQRNLKALGTFGYQATIRGNRYYLRYIAHTARNVRRNLLRFPEFSDALGILSRTGALPNKRDLQYPPGD